MEKNEKKEYIKPMMEEVPVELTMPLAASDPISGDIENERENGGEWDF